MRNLRIKILSKVEESVAEAVSEIIVGDDRSPKDP